MGRGADAVADLDLDLDCDEEVEEGETGDEEMASSLTNEALGALVRDAIDLVAMLRNEATTLERLRRAMDRAESASKGQQSQLTTRAMEAILKQRSKWTQK